jgi:hypothetical protein
MRRPQDSRPDILIQQALEEVGSIDEDNEEDLEEEFTGTGWK